MADVARERRRLGADRLARLERRAATSTPPPASGCWPRCASSATGPNSAARALRSGRFHSIGVIMFTLSSVGNIRTLDAIAAAATDAGYVDHLHPRAGPHPGRGLGRVRPARRAGRRRHHHHHRGAPARRGDVALPAGLPVVVVDSSAGDRLPDRRHRPGPRRPAGHRAPARTSVTARSGTSPGPSASYSAARRRDGRGRRRCEAHGADGAARARRATGRPSPGYEAGLAARRATPTSPRSSPRTTRWRSACCAPCTSAAARCPATSASSASTTWRSPRSFWPPLTTVHQYFAEVGRRSVEELLHEVETGERGGSTLVATELDRARQHGAAVGLTASARCGAATAGTRHAGHARRSRPGGA